MPMERAPKMARERMSRARAPKIGRKKMPRARASKTARKRCQGQAHQDDKENSA